MTARFTRLVPLALIATVPVLFAAQNSASRETMLNHVSVIDMTGRHLDDAGTVLFDVPRLNMRPLANIAWLVAELKKAGTPLKKGDFISLRSPAPMQPVVAGRRVTLRYEGLPGGPMTSTVKIR